MLLVNASFFSLVLRNQIKVYMMGCSVETENRMKQENSGLNAAGKKFCLQKQKLFIICLFVCLFGYLC